MKVAGNSNRTHNPFEETYSVELLDGKHHEQFLWGGTGNGSLRYRASPLPDNYYLSYIRVILKLRALKADQNLSECYVNFMQSYA